MSRDETICTNLIRTLEDGKNGFESAAGRLYDDGRPDVAAQFQQFARERAEMAAELQMIADAYGDDIDRRGTMAAALHRGWMGLKDALTGNDADAVINTAEQGEDHAVEQFREALGADISPEFKSVVARQYTSVQRAHDYVRALKSAA